MNSRCLRRARRGMVLVLAMWVVLVLSGMMLVMARVMRGEMSATANRLAAAQAEWTARGALACVRAYLADIPPDGGEGAPGAGIIPAEAVPLGDGYFWLLKPDPEDGSRWLFGLNDEASRLNINAADEDMLLMLPGVCAETAAAIVDWRSPEETGVPGGAKSEYYLLLSPPYQCKSGPFETLEELLLVRGVTPEMLFGPVAGSPGGAERGIHHLLTVHSSERGVAAAGDGPVNVNARSLARLNALLAEAVPADRLPRVIAEIRRNRPFYNLFDFFFRSGLMRDEFDRVAGRLSVGRRGRRVGLVNVNTASAEVLLTLPGLDSFDVEMLLARRSASGGQAVISWVLDVLPEEKAVAAGDWITARTFQYSADILAVSADGRAFRRFRAVLDNRVTPPRVLDWQELTGEGWPLAPEVLSALRAGGPPPLMDYRGR